MRPPMGRGGGGRFGGGRGGGRGGFGGRGGGFGRGGRGGYDEGPPAQVIEAGTFEHPCEGEAVCKMTLPEKVPMFNAAIFLENKTKVGKVDEIFGKINGAYFTIKMDDGVVATSYSSGDKFFIDPFRTLPLDRFLPRPKGAPGASPGRGGRGGGRGGGRFGGRGGGGRFGGGGGGRFGGGGGRFGGGGGGRFGGGGGRFGGGGRGRGRGRF